MELNEHAELDWDAVRNLHIHRLYEGQAASAAKFSILSDLYHSHAIVIPQEVLLGIYRCFVGS